MGFRPDPRLCWLTLSLGIVTRCFSAIMVHARQMGQFVHLAGRDVKKLWHVKERIMTSIKTINFMGRCESSSSLWPIVLQVAPCQACCNQQLNLAAGFTGGLRPGRAQLWTVLLIWRVFAVCLAAEGWTMPSYRTSVVSTDCTDTAGVMIPI